MASCIGPAAEYQIITSGASIQIVWTLPDDFVIFIRGTSSSYSVMVTVCTTDSLVNNYICFEVVYRWSDHYPLSVHQLNICRLLVSRVCLLCVVCPYPTSCFVIHRKSFLRTHTTVENKITS